MGLQQFTFTNRKIFFDAKHFNRAFPGQNSKLFAFYGAAGGGRDFDGSAGSAAAASARCSDKF